MFNLNQYSTSLVVWRLLDSKPGHERQSLGLVNAMKLRTPVNLIDITVTHPGMGWLYWLRGIWPYGKGLPRPDLIVGAGHATHGHMLAAKRTYGGKTVCMMQPSLPACMFDVCLIPEHDEYRGHSSFIETRGVINHIQPVSVDKKDSNDVLIMIGGPSKHFHWDELGVVAQVYDLVRKHAEVNFVLTTSRRTPDTFVTALQRVRLSNLTVVSYAETGKDWVQTILARVSTAWVTEDSVSMVYEALTAQVAVGLINLPAKDGSRVSRGIEKLIDRQLVTRYDPYGLYRQDLHPVIGFDEAGRCVDALLAYFGGAYAKGRLISRLS